MKSILSVALLLAGATVAPQQAQAACLKCSCTVAAPALAFSAYSITQVAPSYSSTDVQVTCTGPAGLALGYEIALGKGTGPSPGARRMASGSAALAYNLYRDRAYMQVWGEGSGGAAPMLGVVTMPRLGAVTAHNVAYGRIPARQNVPPGSYSDTLVLTVTY